MPTARSTRTAAKAGSVAERKAETVKITTGLAARIIGIKERQLSNLRQQGCPLPEGGVKTVDDIEAIVAWRMNQMREMLTDKLPENVDDIELEEKRTNLKVKQIKLAKELDLVLDEAAYFHHLSVLWGEANSLLDSMESKLPPLLIGLQPDEMADKIRDFVSDLKMRFNPEEAMRPAQVALDLFTDEVAELNPDDDDEGEDHGE